MELQVHKAPLSYIQDLRNLSLRENHFQFVHDKCYGADWADTYVFSIGNDTVGFGSVWGKDGYELTLAKVAVLLTQP